jgi:dTDP-4-dehydrorhamnose 3,5-epimerase
MYNKSSERRILYNDKFLNIDWKINPDKAIISAKDVENPVFEKAEMNF